MHYPEYIGELIDKDAITFEMRALDADGEVIVRAESSIDFHDLSMSTEILQEKLEKILVERHKDDEWADKMDKADDTWKERSY